MSDFGTDDKRLDQRLSMLWNKLTDNSREVRALHPRTRTLEKRVDRIEQTLAEKKEDHRG
ncbi:hypothetical protein MTQ12_00200 [Brevibacterium sp. R8603A2]|uniref:hypothetical protein n=1 Tax=Brevibacterium sp. R8603A2 TaxID=2929779 RepID=UPI001FF91EC6|nr:hypothetical protein [Brevibacterium sp. R8603A2]MCK1801481.1 hypothetical protein [Brevibacterium sp. R8603A2]